MTIDVFLEIGPRRTFASAIAWPGWARSGRDAEAAVQALHAYGPRYASALRGTRLGFHAPTDLHDFVITERVPGNANTDYGALGLAAATDTLPLDAAELKRLHKVLDACWHAFDAAAEAAAGHTLRTGPRGGGRTVAKMQEHVLGAEAAYLSRVGAPFKLITGADPVAELARIRVAIAAALDASAAGTLPTHGPRGAVHWAARTFVRRVAWHTLDHAWEVEDRIIA